MTMQQVLTLMTQNSLQAAGVDWRTILAAYAQTVADVSGKVTQQELGELIGLGAVIYRKGQEEFNQTN